MDSTAAAEAERVGKNTGDPREAVSRDQQGSAAVTGESLATLPAQEPEPPEPAASLYAQAARKDGLRAAARTAEESSASPVIRTAEGKSLDQRKDVVLDPEADPEPDPDHDPADPLAGFRESQQRAAVDFQTQVRQSDKSGATLDGQQPRAKQRKPRPQHAAVVGDQRESDMYAGTQQGSEQRPSDGLPGDNAVGVVQRRADGLLPRGADGAALTTVGMSSVGALAAAAEPVEGLSEVTAGIDSALASGKQHVVSDIQATKETRTSSEPVVGRNGRDSAAADDRTRAGAGDILLRRAGASPQTSSP